MRSKLPLLALIIMASVGCRTMAPMPEVAAEDATTQMAQQSVDAVLWQATSAEAHRLYQQCFELAAIRLRENLDRSDGEKPAAIIIDVDETVLDNSHYELERIAVGKTYDHASWVAWTDRAEATLLPGVGDLLQYAAELHCEVFYVTNRSAEEHESTMRNLARFDLPNVDAEHVLVMTDGSDKTTRRASILKTHRVVLYLGDALRDFDEVFKDRSIEHGKRAVDDRRAELAQLFIMLPNPMYGTWRDAITGKGTPEEKLERVRTFIQKRSVD